nr:phospholipase D-like domain-containing protein [Methylocystis echinoides]
MSSGRARVNFADQALNDRIVIESLSNAVERSAHIRIYLDPREVERITLDGEHPFVKLSRMRNVEIKLKASADSSMRLKGYSVNGSLLRIGSANETHPSLERQDNELVVITEKDAVAAFDRNSMRCGRDRTIRNSPSRKLRAARITAP